MSAPVAAGLTPEEVALATASIWDLRPHPWVTFDMLLRLDAIDRRETAMLAIMRWQPGNYSLWSAAKAEFEAAEADEENWYRDVDVLAAAWCSWP